MVIRLQHRRYRRKVRARARGSERDRERASATAGGQGMDQARMETRGLTGSRLVAAIREERGALVVRLMMTGARLVMECCSERVCYRSRNRSTRKTRAGIRLRGRSCCA